MGLQTRPALHSATNTSSSRTANALERKNKHSKEADFQRKLRLQRRSNQPEDFGSSGQASVPGLAAIKENVGEGAELATENAALRQENSALRSQAEIALRRLQTLQAQVNEESVRRMVDGAIAEWKLIPPQRDWAIALGRADLAGLHDYLNGCAPMKLWGSV